MQGAGFGYDSKTNDFKIIRFGHEGSSNDWTKCLKSGDQGKYIKTKTITEVYRMRRDCWREIRTCDSLQFCCCSYIGNKVFCRGVFIGLSDLIKTV